jgi:hypothetical protein
VTAWKTFSHGNAKGKGINYKGWVNNQVFRLAEEEKKKRRSEISGRDLQKPFEEFKIRSSLQDDKY